MKRIAVLGSGIVGETLANGLLKHGYSVTRGSRAPAKLADWVSQAGSGADAGTFAEAAARCDAVVLAAKGTAAETVVNLCGAKTLAGKAASNRRCSSAATTTAPGKW